MSTVDPRFAHRRKIVAEHGARRRLRSMSLTALALALLGLAWWATQSELLDIDSIAIGSASEVDVRAVLSNNGLREGSTLVSAILAADDVEADLESDPWVLAATVNVLFPGKIEIEVIERRAVVAVATPEGGWTLAAADSTLLEGVEVVPAELGRIADPALLASGLDFLGVMGDRAAGTTVSSVDGEVWVEHGGVMARLGRATDMEAKAAAFVALLEEEIEPGWAINLVAPSRPALFRTHQP